jgi:hypothetical protein
MPVTTFGTPLNGAVPPRYLDVNPPQTPYYDGTYPYDGGPSTNSPAPQTAPAPSAAPQRTVPLEGRSVSLPKPAGKWAYPAYGEAPRRTSFAADRTLLTKGEPKKARSR